MGEFEVVERRDPDIKRGRTNARNRALIETAETGKAIRIALNGTSYNVLTNGLYLHASRQGYRCRVRRDGDTHIIAWVEKKS